MTVRTGLENKKLLIRINFEIRNDVRCAVFAKIEKA